MSSKNHDTFSPHNLSVLGGLLLVALILGEVVFDRHSDPEIIAPVKNSPEDIALRLKPVVSLDDLLQAATVSLADDGANQTPAQRYQASCFACHGTGAAGAPKLGDGAAWAGRMSKGIDGLVASAIAGVGAMPPRGASQFDDQQLREVIEYILAKSK